jgi:hypothetical protein
MIQLSLAGAGSKVLRLLMEEYPIPTIIVLLISLWLLFFYQNTQYGWKEGGKPFLIGLTKWFVAPIIILLTIGFIISHLVSSNTNVHYDKGKELLKLGKEPWETANRVSAFNNFNDYIKHNPETDSAYYYRAMCFLESYTYSNREGVMTVYDFSRTKYRKEPSDNPTEIRIPSEYTFANAISDLRTANSHNSNIVVYHQINSAIFKSILLTIENRPSTIRENASYSNYFQDIPQTELDEFLSNLMTCEYADVPYPSFHYWTALSMGSSEVNIEDTFSYYRKNFNSKNGIFLLNCWVKIEKRMEIDKKRFTEFIKTHNFEYVDFELSKYCAVIENGNDTIQIPLDSIGLKNFAENRLGNIQRQLVVRPK